jgi:hypothetical protein
MIMKLKEEARDTGAIEPVKKKIYILVVAEEYCEQS